MYLYAGVGLVAAATLILQIVLTRVFAISQWYHYAFLSISLAFLGFGASGSALTAWPARLARREPLPFLGLLAALFAVATLAGYLAVNRIPFDPFRITIDARQILYLAMQYAALLVPFFFAGCVTGWAPSRFPADAPRLYFASLSGAGLGALAAPAAIGRLGEAGAVALVALMGAAAALLVVRSDSRSLLHAPDRRAAVLLAACVLALSTLVLVQRPAAFEVRLSEYKGLSQILHFPGTTVRQRLQNAFSRIDVVDSPLIHHAPGLSLRYAGALPAQWGIFADGDDLTAVTPVVPGEHALFRHLLTALPYAMRRAQEVLIVNPRGGLDVLTALAWGARSITVVEDNPLISGVVRQHLETAAAHSGARLAVVNTHARSYLARPGPSFDVIQVSLTDGFSAVTAGAYSLHENYIYTVEGVRSALARLAPGGILALTRWLQSPPSECVRLWATVLAALEPSGDPGASPMGDSLAAARTWRLMSVLVKRGAFTPGEVQALRNFTSEQAFDLVYFPGIVPGDANRYNVLPEPVYYRFFGQLLSGDREAFFRTYPFDVRPPTDDRPFFFHFFKWSQVPSIVGNLGRQWQPFGGGGFLVVLLYLVIATLLAAALILLPLTRVRTSPTAAPRTATLIGAPPQAGVPVAATHRAGGPDAGRHGVLAYFFLLGVGFLFVEVPLMHRFILFLDHPTQAFATVLGGLLTFSGLGSLLSARLAPRYGPWILWLLAAVVLVHPLALGAYVEALVGADLGVRVLLTLAALAPFVLLGMPFPLGLRRLAETSPALVPWAWAVNGCASVLASILGILIALGSGYRAVLLLGGLAYLLAGAVFAALTPGFIRRLPVRRPAAASHRR